MRSRVSYSILMAATSLGLALGHAAIAEETAAPARPELAIAPATPAAATSAKAPEGAKGLAESSYSASDFLGSADDMRKFTDEAFATRFDTTKAAKVENLVLKRDAGEWTLDGYMFLRQGVRGLVSQAQFFGKGRFKLTPPLDMERQQVRRFLGTDSIDLEFNRCRLTFTALADQQLLEGLSYTADNAKAAKEGDDGKPAKEWSEQTDKYYDRGLTDEEAAREKFRFYETVLNLYSRLLYPKREGAFDVNMATKDPEGTSSGHVRLSGMTFHYEPYDTEEVSVVAAFDHGKYTAHSVVTEFARADMYDGRYDYGATSAALEKRSRQEAKVLTNQLTLSFDPSGKHDTHMATKMQVEFLEDGIKALPFYVTPYMGTTKAWLDGKEVGFVQPEVPQVPSWHAGVIALPLPRSYNKGEKLEVALELDGKILKNFDGSTWIVKDEDNWYPVLASPYSWGFPVTFDITMRFPKGYVGVSNGEPKPCRSEDEQPDMECLRFVPNRPIDAATFNFGKGIKVDRGTALDGTPVAVYTNKETKREFAYWTDAGILVKKEYSLSKTGPEMVNRAMAALGVYEEWFGENPFTTLSLTPHPAGHGRGFASLLLLYQGAFLTTVDQDEWAGVIGVKRVPYTVDQFISHEIAHQWWGGAAGIRSSRDQWFSEGFADYGADLYLEAVDRTNGTNWHLEQLQEWMNPLLKDDGYLCNLVSLAQGNRVASAENGVGFDDGSVRQTFMYGKGAFVLHMLRAIARAKEADPVKGDLLFKKGMHSFFEEQSGKHPSNLDLQLSMSKSYGMDLTWFFKQWVYGVGLPKLEFDYAVAPRAGGGYTLTGHVRQLDTNFRFPLPVYLHFGKGKNAQEMHFYQWITDKDQTFEGPLPQSPDKVTLNDDLGLLCSWKEVPRRAAAGE